jgi:hypothetical protein
MTALAPKCETAHATQDRYRTHPAVAHHTADPKHSTPAPGQCHRPTATLTYPPHIP